MGIKENDRGVEDQRVQAMAAGQWDCLLTTLDSVALNGASGEITASYFRPVLTFRWLPMEAERTTWLLSRDSGMAEPS